jgi:hypothetical protein
VAQVQAEGVREQGAEEDTGGQERRDKMRNGEDCMNEEIYVLYCSTNSIWVMK